MKNVEIRGKRKTFKLNTQYPIPDTRTPVPEIKKPNIEMQGFDRKISD